MMSDSEKKALLDEIKITSGVNPRKCMVCGKCTAACPAIGEDDVAVGECRPAGAAYRTMEWKPHQFVQMFADGDVSALLDSAMLYRCMSCMACLERCPRGVEPARVVAAVRVAVERRRGEGETAAMAAMEDMLKAAEASCIPQQALVSAFRKYRK